RRMGRGETRIGRIFADKTGKGYSLEQLRIFSLSFRLSFLLSAQIRPIRVPPCPILPASGPFSPSSSGEGWRNKRSRVRRAAPTAARGWRTTGRSRGGNRSVPRRGEY